MSIRGRGRDGPRVFPSFEPLKWVPSASEQPTDSESNAHRGVRLLLDNFPRGRLEGAGSFLGGRSCGICDIRNLALSLAHRAVEALFLSSAVVHVTLTSG